MNLFPDRLQFDTAHVIFGIWAAIGVIFGYLFHLRGEVKGSDLKSKFKELEKRVRHLEQNQPLKTDGNKPDENGKVPPLADR